MASLIVYEWNEIRSVLVVDFTNEMKFIHCIQRACCVRFLIRHKDKRVVFERTILCERHAQVKVLWEMSYCIDSTVLKCC